tara:strand:- start:1309 stop:1566 length:258 start_codon:yes stop_codon:yes gene_type:complete
MAKQRLSPAAAKAKKKRDLAYAKTPRRRKMKAANQKRRRDAVSKGINVDSKDFDHTTMSWVSVNKNRSGFGKGTKKNNTKGSSRV